MRISVWSALFGVFLVAVPGAGQTTPAGKSEVISATYSEFLIAPPTPSWVTICHGFGCKIPSEVRLGAADRAQLGQLMAPGRSSAEAERRAIAAAAAWFDRRVAPVAGTQNHVARAGSHYSFDSAGQFDCIDSSRNMTSLLLLLDEFKLLRYHVPDVPAARGYIVDFRLPHATAVLTEKASGASFAVDAWTRAYGQPPEIMPLERWKAGRGS